MFESKAFQGIFINATIFFMVFVGILIFFKILWETGLMPKIPFVEKIICIYRKISIKEYLTSKLKLITLKLNPNLIKEAKLFFSFLFIATGSRVFIYFFGFLWSYFNKNVDAGFIESFRELWDKWDSNHYLYLAENGYTSEGHEVLFIVFYPLYPLLVRLTSFIFKDLFLSGVILSNFCISIASYYLYKLVKMDFDKETAFASVKYMLIFPLAFFFGIFYTESLYIAITIIFFYYLRKNNLFVAGIFGLLAAMTKVQGILLTVPAIVEIVISLKIPNLSYVLQNKKSISVALFKKCIFMLLIPLGFGIYLLINKTVNGDWFSFLEYQRSNWNNGFGFIGDTLSQHFYYMLDASRGLYRITIWMPQLAFIGILLVLMVYSINKIRVSYNSYMFIYTFVIYSATWLISGARYILCLFPLYIILALITRNNKYIDFILTFVSTILLAYYTINFIENAVY